MIYKKSGEVEIHALFPKPIFKVDNLFIDKLDYYKKLIKSYNKKLIRDDYNNVDSNILQYTR